MPIRLGGKAHRLAARHAHAGEILEIIDYKTNDSGKVPTLDSLHSDLPIFLYYVLARISYPQFKQIRITLLNVLTLAQVSVNYDPAQVAANKQSLLGSLKSLAAGNFAPLSSEACAWCSFRDECPEFNRIVDFDGII